MGRRKLRVQDLLKDMLKDADITIDWDLAEDRVLNEMGWTKHELRNAIEASTIIDLQEGVDFEVIKPKDNGNRNLRKVGKLLPMQEVPGVRI
jgi:hypothetical protein